MATRRKNALCKEPGDKTPDGLLIEVRQVREELCGGGTYIMIPFAFFQLMKQDDALVLSFLMNQQAMFAELGILPADNYFYCTDKTIESRLGYERHRLSRILERLEEMGFIDAELRYDRPSQPKRRYIKVFQHRILKRVRKYYDEEDSRRQALAFHREVALDRRGRFCT